MSDPMCFVGIDVSKDTLDICIFPTGEPGRTEYRHDEFFKLIDRLTACGADLIAVEATPGKVALTATMSKLLLIINAMFQNQPQLRFARA